jgi:threonine dehydrogenase-like Zn-dependent dehydrogenase
MRALQVLNARSAQVVRDAIQEPGSGQVRVALEGSGVCASSVPVWEGRPWFTYPMEPGSPGHEGWGAIEAIGPGVAGLSPGDRVASLGNRAFASHEIVAADQVIPIDGIPDGVPFPGEAFGCAANVARAARISPGARVAVIGVGFLGAVVVRLASTAGAHVVAISRREWALDLAESLGANETIRLGDAADVVRIARGPQDIGVDVAIEAIGAQQSLDLAASITREQGRIVIAGYHQDGPRTIDLQLWNWRAFEIVNAHWRSASAYASGLREAVAAVRVGVIQPERFVTHVLPLDRLGDAMTLIRERPDGFLKAVVLP